jgi:hypothetical protein
MKSGDLRCVILLDFNKKLFLHLYRLFPLCAYDSGSVFTPGRDLSLRRSDFLLCKFFGWIFVAANKILLPSFVFVLLARLLVPTMFMLPPKPCSSACYSISASSVFPVPTRAWTFPFIARLSSCRRSSFPVVDTSAEFVLAAAIFLSLGFRFARDVRCFSQARVSECLRPSYRLRSCLVSRPAGEVR